MKSRIPKWAQPFGEERFCSICHSPKVYYERAESWEEKIELHIGPIIRCTNFAMKCWCKDCFEDCGGKHD
jgi:hypothetical protein